MVWCGPTRGWLGFDPTNGCTVGGDHFVAAIGRDYADVAPIDGIFLGRRTARKSMWRSMSSRWTEFGLDTFQAASPGTHPFTLSAASKGSHRRQRCFDFAQHRMVFPDTATWL